MRQMVDWIWIYNNQAVTKPKKPEQKPFMPKKYKKCSKLIKKLSPFFPQSTHTLIKQFSVATTQ